MKKILLPIALLLLMASCHRTKSNSNEVKTESYVVSDSVYLENDYEDGYSRYTVNIDLPVTDNDTLRQNIMYWMLDDWTEDYQSYFETSKTRFFEEEGSEPNAEFEGNYTLANQTDYYVTYISEGYIYAGGAHSLPWYYGTTFSKQDGSVMGYDLFEDPEQLIDLVTENLNLEWLDNNEDYLGFGGTFGLPTNQPWIETDSVVFCYGPYEIAPYSEGMPLCKIAIDDLKPYLSERGKELLNIK